MIRVHTTVRVVHRKWNICIRDRYAEVVDFGPKHFAQHPDRQVGAELAEFTGSDIEKTLLNALRVSKARRVVTTTVLRSIRLTALWNQSTRLLKGRPMHRFVSRSGRVVREAGFLVQARRLGAWAGGATREPAPQSAPVRHAQPDKPASRRMCPVPDWRRCSPIRRLSSCGVAFNSPSAYAMSSPGSTVGSISARASGVLIRLCLQQLSTSE